MKNISLLSISNSFGVNLQKYASQIASSNGFKLDIYVLYIGGCTLEKHASNIKINSNEYDLYHNGECEKHAVTIKEVLKLTKWDYIITQQASHLSPNYATFFPYINEIFNYVKENAIYKKLGIQETWEYGKDYKKNDGKFFTKKDSLEMYEKVSNNYSRAAKELNLDIIFNSGDVIHKATAFFNKDFHADGYHLNDEGCYLIGLNLVKQLFNKNIKKAYVTNDISIETCNKLVDFINKI